MAKKSYGVNGVVPSEISGADSGGKVLGEEAASPLPNSKGFVGAL